MPRKTRQIPVSLTEKQIKAVESAFPDSKDSLSEKLRSLIAGGLALYQIEWPPDVQHGGKRQGAGRRKTVVPVNE